MIGTLLTKLVKRLKGTPMFQQLVIHLDGPICRCRVQALEWGITIVEHNGTLVNTLIVSCKTCGQRLQVAPAEFKASFYLDEKYPDSGPKITKNGSLIDASAKFTN